MPSNTGITSANKAGSADPAFSVIPVKNPKFISISLAIIAGAAFLFFRQHSQAAAEIAFFESAEFREVHAATYLKGEFTYQQQVRLTSEVLGRVKEIFVSEGDEVTVGQPLIQIDDTNLIDTIEQAQSAVARAELEVRRTSLAEETSFRTLERKRTLAKQKMISGQDVDTSDSLHRSDVLSRESAQFALRQAKAALMQVARQRSKLLIRSPLSGVVINVHIQAGETAINGTQNMQGSELITIADPQSMVVRTHLPEGLVGKVEVGQRAVISRRQPGTQTIAGKVLSLSKKFQAEDSFEGPASSPRGLAALIGIGKNDNDGRILAGMGCDVMLVEGGDTPVLTVPVSALRYELKKSDSGYIKGEAREYYVFVVTGDEVAKRVVVPGAADQDWQEIRRGIRKGERVVAGPASLIASLKDGDRLTAAQPQ